MACNEESTSTLFRLESLPWELLLSICEHLARREPRTKRSLCNFALASRRCCEATDLQRFRQIHFEIRGPRRLHRDVQSWRRRLAQTEQRLGLVRVIKITGSSITPRQEEEEEQQGASDEYDPKQGHGHQTTRQLRMPGFMGYNADEEDDEVPKLLSGMDYDGLGVEFYPAPSTRWPDEEPWQPLVELCGELPGLADVVFASVDQFPRCLLTHLHERHPECRLHMHHFGLRSVIHPELEAQEPLHPDDVALASSPCLRSIVCVADAYRHCQVVDHNEEVVVEMISGLAPRLENVYMMRTFHTASVVPMSTVPRPPFRGFPPLEEGAAPALLPQQRIRLRNFTFNGCEIEAEGLARWTGRADLTRLRSLAFKSGINPSGIKHLTRMALQGSLPELASLRIAVRPYQRLTLAMMSEREEPLDSTVADLFATLRPLTELYVEGCAGERCFDAITSHQGEKLQTLHLTGEGFDGEPPFAVSLAAAGRLAQNCRQLRELELRVDRTPGDEQEAAIYRHIGSLPHLKRINLLVSFMVDCRFRNTTYLLSGTTASPIETLQGVYREAAMDASLATCIFGLLSTGNQLRTLRLLPDQVGAAWGPQMAPWLRWLSRAWVVRRDAGGIVTAKEHDAEQREQALREIQEVAFSPCAQVHKEAWDATWPSASDAWWDDWSSVPLKMTGKRKLDCTDDALEERDEGSSRRQ